MATELIFRHVLDKLHACDAVDVNDFIMFEFTNSLGNYTQDILTIYKHNINYDLYACKINPDDTQDIINIYESSIKYDVLDIFKKHKLNNRKLYKIGHHISVLQQVDLGDEISFKQVLNIICTMVERESLPIDIIKMLLCLYVYQLILFTEYPTFAFSKFNYMSPALRIVIDSLQTKYNESNNYDYLLNIILTGDTYAFKTFYDNILKKCRQCINMKNKTFVDFSDLILDPKSGTIIGHTLEILKQTDPDYNDHHPAAIEEAHILAIEKIRNINLYIPIFNDCINHVLIRELDLNKIYDAVINKQTSETEKIVIDIIHLSIIKYITRTRFYIDNDVLKYIKR